MKRLSKSEAKRLVCRTAADLIDAGGLWEVESDMKTPGYGGSVEDLSGEDAERVNEAVAALIKELRRRGGLK